MSLTRSLATVALQTAGILAAVALLAAIIGVRARRSPQFRTAAVTAIAVVVFAVGGSQLADALSTLNKARRASSSAQAGVGRCFDELQAQSKLPFVRWARARMGHGAVYDIDYAPQPDVLCLLTNLLPALPARPGQPAGWTIAFGVVPPEMQAKIARRDPTVVVYAPGYALERNGPS